MERNYESPHIEVIEIEIEGAILALSGFTEGDYLGIPKP